MRTCLLVLALAISLGLCSSTQAVEPVPYWTVAPSYSPSGAALGRPKTRYAYGWFGARTARHATHHHQGYYGTYFDWIIR